MSLTALLALSGLAAPAVASAPAAAAAPVRKIILDTDIGGDVDDAYALALFAALPSVKLMAVTTAYGETGKRVPLAAKLLKVMGQPGVPVAAGRSGEAKVGPQCDWAAGFRSRSMVKKSAVELMRGIIKANPGEVTLVAIGALTNVADLITQHPEVKPQIKGLVIMGGAARVGYNNQPPAVPECNIVCDPAAARIVFAAGLPLRVAALDATTMMQLDLDRQKRLFAYGTPVTDALAALTILWGNTIPTLFDPVAVADAAGVSYWQTEPLRLGIREDAVTTIEPGAPNCTFLVNPDKEGFLDWYVEAVGKGTAGR